MYKKILIVLGVVSCVICFFAVSQPVLAAGHVEQIRVDVEKSHVAVADADADTFSTALSQNAAQTKLILLAKNCADVCGPSPTKECDKWGKNHCCECCEPLPRHCYKKHRWHWGNWYRDRWHRDRWYRDNHYIGNNNGNRDVRNDFKDDKSEKEDRKRNGR